MGKSAARFQWSPFFNCLSHVVVGFGIPGTRIKRHKSPCIYRHTYIHMLVCVCVCSYLRHLLFTPFAVATPLRFGAVWLIAQWVRGRVNFENFCEPLASFMVQIRHFALLLLLLPRRLVQLKFHRNSPIENTPTKSKREKRPSILGILLSLLTLCTAVVGRCSGRHFVFFFCQWRGQRWAP